jgi:hypothetical protein
MYTYIYKYIQTYVWMSVRLAASKYVFLNERLSASVHVCLNGFPFDFMKGRPLRWMYSSMSGGRIRYLHSSGCPLCYMYFTKGVFSCSLLHTSSAKFRLVLSARWHRIRWRFRMHWLAGRCVPYIRTTISAPSGSSCHAKHCSI